MSCSGLPAARNAAEPPNLRFAFLRPMSTGPSGPALRSASCRGPPGHLSRRACRRLHPCLCQLRVLGRRLLGSRGLGCRGLGYRVLGYRVTDLRVMTPLVSYDDGIHWLMIPYSLPLCHYLRARGRQSTSCYTPPPGRGLEPRSESRGVGPSPKALDNTRSVALCWPVKTGGAVGGQRGQDSASSTGAALIARDHRPCPSPSPSAP